MSLFEVLFGHRCNISCRRYGCAAQQGEEDYSCGGPVRMEDLVAAQKHVNDHRRLIQRGMHRSVYAPMHMALARMALDRDSTFTDFRYKPGAAVRQLEAMSDLLLRRYRNRFALVGWSR